MVDQQGRHLRHGKCSTILGQNSSPHFETAVQPLSQVDWGFVFVDDFCWLLRAEHADHQATAILATLVALGVPLSWKKTHLAEVNTWLVGLCYTPQHSTSPDDLDQTHPGLRSPLSSLSRTQ